jgi:hypothetical protein
MQRDGHTRTLLTIAAAAIVAFAVWAAFPRQPSLTNFDPDALARADTDMWRAYYDKRYPALFGELYTLSRREYGFSPLDSLRLAFCGAGGQDVPADHVAPGG